LGEERTAYYIHVGNGEILRTSKDSPWNFRIFATDEEITRLREVFESNYSVEWQNFFRSHVPYVQYHYDRENDDYDRNLQKIYKMIYELGDDEAKHHIEKMGILDSD